MQFEEGREDRNLLGDFPDHLVQIECSHSDEFDAGQHECVKCKEGEHIADYLSWANDGVLLLGEEEVMKKIIVCFVFFAQCLFGGATAFGRPTCDDPLPLLPDYRLTLKQVKQNDRGLFVGTFELVNYQVTPGILVPGEAHERSLSVGRPDAATEFRDLNGHWEMVYDGRPVEDFLPDRPGKLLRKGETMAISSELFPLEYIKRDGSDFRLVIYAKEPGLCLVSHPFRALPLRPPVTHFRSLTEEEARQR